MGRICITLAKELEETIKKEAGAQGISKSEYIAQGLAQFLRTKDQKPEQMGDQALMTALKESQRDRETLERQIHDLEKVLVDKEQDLSWAKGQMVESQRNLTAALAKIPMITDGSKPWWQFWRRAE